MKKLLLLSLIGGVMVIGCSKNEGSETPDPKPPVPPTESTKIPIAVSAGVLTRATDFVFEQNDKIGIYVVNFNGIEAGVLGNSGNHVDNMCFTYTGTWSPATPIYWKDQTTKADFYCYYPYSSSMSNVSAYPFAVRSDQSNETNYKASDFMWGKRDGVTPTSDPIQIMVKHTMSNLIIKLKAGQGYTDADMERASISICGLKTNATVNLANGIATATGNASNIVPLKNGDGYRALIVPQSVSETKLIEVSIDGYHFNLIQSITFETNKQHTCTLTVNRIGNGINIGIGDWQTDDKDYGGTVE